MFSEIFCLKKKDRPESKELKESYLLIGYSLSNFEINNENNNSDDNNNDNNNNDNNNNNKNNNKIYNAFNRIGYGTDRLGCCNFGTFASRAGGRSFENLHIVNQNTLLFCRLQML